MQRHQFEAYLDKVFDWSGQVAALSEGRQSPQHPWKKVWDAIFLGAAVQIPNLHRLEAECRAGSLRATDRGAQRGHDGLRPPAAGPGSRLRPGL